MTAMIDWNWISRNANKIWGLLIDHAILSYVPILVGVVLAIPLGIACVRLKWLYPIMLAGSTAFFAIPSIALFVFMLPITGLTRLTALVPLMLYSTSLLIRNVVDGISGADESVRQAAGAMGFTKLHSTVSVELPIAVPSILGGLRVATVANIGMVAVVSVLGLPSLGDLFIDGTQRSFLTPIILGIVLITGLAAISDMLLVVLQRRLTPWSRGR